jgi:hypothetical protein
MFVQRTVRHMSQYLLPRECTECRRAQKWIVMAQRDFGFGRVGISAANTIAQRHMQTHRNENVHWLSGSNWLFRRELNIADHPDAHARWPETSFTACLCLDSEGPR